jgi:hypothetical protein
MTEALDKVLHEQDRKLAINQFFQDKLGATAGQAEIASRSLADNFKLVGATLMFGDKLATDAVEDLSAHLKRQGYDFLLPSSDAPDLTKHAVDPALLDRAFVQGSPDARAEVLRRVGRDSAKLDKLAQDYGLRDAKDYRRGVGKRPEKDGAGGGNDKPKTPNPWSAEHWNLTEQGAVYRRSPSIAKSLAESAGSRIGATKPPRAA